MILDAENRDEYWFHDRVFDVCVVGAGPAGITLSRSLAKHNRNVCLLEGGGLSASRESQDLYRGDVIGFNYAPLDVTRLRFFGGSSNHWGGWCRPLDQSDFEPHRANPYSGWPITKVDLDPYAKQADRILDIKNASKSTRYFAGRATPFQSVEFSWSAPTRFGMKYRKELGSSNRIHLYLKSNLIGIRLDHSRRQVVELVFKSFRQDGSFSIRAKYYVLCLGGIENARALLSAQGDARYAIGNEFDQVGRYFCEHLHYGFGNALFRKKRPAKAVFLGPSPEMMERLGILNFGLRFRPPPRVPMSTLEETACSTALTRKIAEAIGTSIDCNPPWWFGIASEQSLNPESRIRLTGKIDRFGLRRVALDWRLSDVDYRTLRIAALQCGAVFASKNLGRIRLDEWVLDPTADLPRLGATLATQTLGNHHMCTTRMSVHPRLGVVNGDCRLHELENLYLGGSSVFATAGHSNPTYTIVQLMLRLGDHLNNRLA